MHRRRRSSGWHRRSHRARLPPGRGHLRPGLAAPAAHPALGGAAGQGHHTLEAWALFALFYLFWMLGLLVLMIWAFDHIGHNWRHYESTPAGTEEVAAAGAGECGRWAPSRRRPWTPCAAARSARRGAATTASATRRSAAGRTGEAASGAHRPGQHRAGGGYRRHGRSRRPVHGAQEGRRQLQRAVPVPRGAHALVHRQSGGEVTTASAVAPAATSSGSSSPRRTWTSATRSSCSPTGTASS